MKDKEEMIHKHDLLNFFAAIQGFCLVDSLLAAIAGIVIEGSEPRTCSGRLWSDKMTASKWDGSSDPIGISKVSTSKACQKLHHALR
ncbi:hypothetical protein BDR06DRAFT_713775 [Suillus hirtellus]|nr:hypothetical protein BDR06DRAFT_713775 [Suillus hirtellus]